ncbi:transporter substrate-binding domain-containing protein [Mycolicibacterium sarraceniae]|uniref:ABC transporter substrate-binding protein n=1 Tax=Mycolicibacterium sarraceniae TaxID=1534348 RepID=A0A7I7SMD5_9MYCO|nr:transporter substrate-binding domain-containing protein [Mycolicibacterium sarraceniae]BBY58144.1 hypothetical protein MSAR_12800 [Mycolicibacterium sarraceniae]
MIAAVLLGGCGSKPDGGAPLSCGVLRVGTEGAYAPFSFQDPATGQLAGHDVDVAISEKYLKANATGAPADAAHRSV